MKLIRAIVSVGKYFFNEDTKRKVRKLLQLPYSKQNNEKYREYISCKKDDIKDDMSELRRSFNDLFENENTLNKYIEKLENANNESELVNNNHIQVIWDFLENWKQEVIRWVKEDNFPLLLEYYKTDSEYCDLHNHFWYIVKQTKELTEEEAKTKLKELYEKSKDLHAAINPLTMSCQTRINGQAALDEDELNKKFWDEVVLKKY